MTEFHIFIDFLGDMCLIYLRIVMSIYLHQFESINTKKKTEEKPAFDILMDFLLSRTAVLCVVGQKRIKNEMKRKKIVSYKLNEGMISVEFDNLI